MSWASAVAEIPARSDAAAAPAAMVRMTVMLPCPLVWLPVDLGRRLRNSRDDFVTAGKSLSRRRKKRPMPDARRQTPDARRQTPDANTDGLFALRASAFRLSTFDFRLAFQLGEPGLQLLELRAGAGEYFALHVVLLARHEIEAPERRLHQRAQVLLEI